jgi:hypothetical protein
MASPPCPVCAGPMSRKLVGRGPRAGLEMWGCRRWPACDGVINIDSPQPDPAASAGSQKHEPSAYAQAMFERALARDRLKRRALLPLAVGIAIVLVALAFVAALPTGKPWIWIAPVVVVVVWMLALLRLPFESLVWAKGIEGERRVAEALEPLEQEGFRFLYNRRIPLARGDIDCVVIGSSGVFVIETKNWGGRASVRNNLLLIGTADRSWVVDQIFRESMAVQIALADEMNRHRMTVVPVVCVVGGISGSERAVSGVQLLEPNSIARWIRERPPVLDAEAIKRIADLAHRALPEPLPWDADR